MAALEQDRFENWFRETGRACFEDFDFDKKLKGSFGDEMDGQYEYEDPDTQVQWLVWVAALTYGDDR